METSIIPTLSLQSLRLFASNNYYDLFPRGALTLLCLASW